MTCPTHIKVRIALHDPSGPAWLMPSRLRLKPRWRYMPIRPDMVNSQQAQITVQMALNALSGPAWLMPSRLRIKVRMTLNSHAVWHFLGTRLLALSRLAIYKGHIVALSLCFLSLHRLGGRLCVLFPQR